MNVCVVALGKIGLPLAVQYASRGHHVIGADVDPRVVHAVNNGDCPIVGETGLEDLLRSAHAAGRMSATTDTEAAVRASDVVVVVVPLLVDVHGTPKFGALDAATAAIGAGLTPGTLVSYETTLPVGTTRIRFAPTLAQISGLTVDEDFFMCFSPERVYSGRIFADLRKYPKIVGGIGPRSTQRAIAFYRDVLEFDDRDDLATPNGVWDVGSSEAAELVKLAETTYRDINIGFANELARYCDEIDIDVDAVIDSANSQPFSHIHRPGVAVGGHCIPVYPRLYMTTDTHAIIPAAARQANEAMPGIAIDRLADMLGGLADRRICVLGLAYRGGVKEMAFSGAFPLVDELLRRGAIATVHDPMYTDDELAAAGFVPHHFGEACDGAIVQSDHDVYRSLRPADLPGLRAIVDGRRVVGSDWPADVPLHVLGRGSKSRR